MQFPRDPFFKDGSRGSDGTSATDNLTPVVSSESHDLFALSSEADEFVTLPEAARFIDTEGDLFNDANTWMTSFSSSTLSTTFTNHEMNVAKLGRDKGGRAYASFPSFVQRPNEVFVRTPQPQYLLNDNMFSSFGALVAENPESQRFQSGSNESEAFDPFAREPTPQKPPAVDRRQVRADRFPVPSSPQGFNYVPRHLFETPINEPKRFDPFPRELTPPPANDRHDIREDCFPISSPPQENNYAAFKADLRKVSRNAGRQPLSPISIQKKAVAIKTQNKPIVLLPTQAESRSASCARKQISEPARPGTSQTATATEKTAQERHAAAEFVSKHEPVIQKRHPATELVSKRAPVIQKRHPAAEIDSTHEPVIQKRHPATELGSKRAPVIQKRHPAAELDSTHEPGIPTVSHPKRFPPSATSTCARPHMEDLLSDISKRKETIRSGKTPESSIATTVEVNNQIPWQHDLRSMEKAVAKGQDAASSPENVAPVSRLKDFVLSATAPTSPYRMKPNGSEASPIATKTKESSQGKVLQELLKRRACKNGEGHSTAVKVQDQTIPQKDPKSCNGASDEMCTADKEPEKEPPLKDDPTYSKYFKMKKMGLPSAAVKNAMERDGMDPAIMDLDPEKSLRAQSSGSDDGPPLKDDPEYTKVLS
jgi:hypothetical protein